MGSDTSNNGPRPSGLGARFEAALPKDRFGDHLSILSGTGQNVAGLAVFVLATLGTNVLISRAFGDQGAMALGAVTLVTQVAFIGGAATRFGMDMAAVRRVAIDVGRGEPGRLRGMMSRAAAIAAVTSVVVGVVVLIGSGAIARAFSAPGAGASAFRAAAVALPFVALCQVYLGGTRGLKIMRHTLVIYWTGQPIAWIALMVMAWSVSKSVGASVLAYAGSWALATVAAWYVWRRETGGFPRQAAGPGEIRELLGYGSPRAPAAVLSQLLFWADYFVFSLYARGSELGVYAAAVRVAQTLVLFLTAVNYMFSPYVADLHARGERDRLDSLYKSLTRWVLAGTMPLLLLLLIAPGPVLRIFGGTFDQGVGALRVLLIGQSVNVAVGSVGFILIMVGRTGWDLAVYAASFALDLAVAFVLVPRLGAEGAATAQAVTLVVANAARLWMVWRFVHIQPFDRHYARLAGPALVGAAAMLGVHVALRQASWPLDLAATGAVGTFLYVTAMLLFGLAPAERGALMRILSPPAGHRPAG